MIHEERRDDSAGRAPQECARRSFRLGCRSKIPDRINRVVAYGTVISSEWVPGSLTYNGSLKGEAECEGKNVPTVLFAPCTRIDSIVRMQEHDEACVCNSPPESVEIWVIEPFPKTLSAHDQSTDMVQRTKLGNGFKEGLLGDSRDKRKETESVETSQNGIRNSGRGSTVIFQVFVQIFCKFGCFCRGEKVQPGVGRAHNGYVDPMLVHELELFCWAMSLFYDVSSRVVLTVAVPILGSNWSSATRFVVKDDQAFFT
jgi:hypothetical protein